MKVLYSPVRSDEVIDYEFNGNEITCVLNGNEYGVYDVSELIGINPFEYTEFMPVRAVWEESGEYHVILINYHRADATEEERFPDWIEV